MKKEAGRISTVDLQKMVSRRDVDQRSFGASNSTETSTVSCLLSAGRACFLLLVRHRTPVCGAAGDAAAYDSAAKNAG